MENLKHSKAQLPAEELVSLIQQGVKSAEQSLVNQYWNSLCFILSRNSRHNEKVEDIAQDTFIIVLEKLRSGQIENPKALGAFIHNIGTNLLIADYRKDTRRKTDTCGESYLTFPGTINDIDQQLSEAKIQALVKQVINELPTERDKELLYRFFIYGESKSLVCDALELSPENFDRVLHRARKRLKQLLALKLNVEVSDLNLWHCMTLALLLYIHLAVSYQSGQQNYFAIKVGDFTGKEHCIDKGGTEIVGELNGLVVSRRWS